MRRLQFILTAFSIAFAGHSCFAQSQGLFNQGQTNQGAATGAQGLGQGGLGQGGFGQGGLGQGGAGQGGLGQGAASGLQLNDIGTLGSQVGQNQFVGQADTSTFVGGREVGQGQAGTTPRFTQAQGGQGFQQPENEQGTERRIRPRYRVAFEYDSLTTATVAERSRQQVRTFQTAFDLPDSITVELDAEGTAVLRGEAVSAAMSRLIAQVVRMEPGIRDVRNELVVPEGPSE